VVVGIRSGYSHRVKSAFYPMFMLLLKNGSKGGIVETTVEKDAIFVLICYALMIIIPVSVGVWFDILLGNI
jgi:hypothetical protein